MGRICIIDVPGLSRELVTHVPAQSALGKWIDSQRVAALTPSWPAVTCAVQATLTTGVPPAKHGIVSNGIATFRSREDQDLIDASSFAGYRRDISFWEQSNQLVQSPRFWQDASGKSRWKTAMLFFQQSMPGFSGQLRPAADIVLTPKPEHGPDGKISSLCWSEPRDMVGKLFAQLGPFPLMNYWGPMAGIASSQWIAKAAAWVWREHRPQLQFVYVPHLDYDLQRFGPASPQARKAVDDVSAALEPLLDAVLSDRGRIMVLSEYAVRAVDRCIAPNRILADEGLLRRRQTPDGRLVDYAASAAFAMVDHQIAHVYVSDDSARQRAEKILRSVDGLHVIQREQLTRLELQHPRSGDLFLHAADNAWLDYRWWNDLSDAPVFARTVDIHRKPGYDPLELFWDRAANALSQDDGLIRGSHGVAHAGEAVFIGDADHTPATLSAADVAALSGRMLQ